MRILTFRWSLLFMVLSIGMFSCSGDEDDVVSSSSELTGQWSLQSNSVRLNDLDIDTFSQDLAQKLGQAGLWEAIRNSFLQEVDQAFPVGSTLVFNDDNTYTDNSGEAGTWQLASDQLTLTNQDDESEVLMVGLLNSTDLQVTTTEESSTAGSQLEDYYDTLKIELTLNFEKLP